ncbi:hypothetical protein HBI56_217860 [Parastagonospora nodorum]|uniref:Secreted protein n=1 Tax=Phaeosphaeria nodorum (strain SN15 / ATCC MYA-4574 / FGSC 10173) TaxID=321614 RepID=A0A7U2FB52_PHANO|nr:hypothetical protein HBH56_226190 [Parastagonospora nodorum]QRD01813.1 hypothetical protein JI435_303370 [Parastagonospora nodorum SN15]KAH3935523.1 hypothetical protein HBH54_032530 [Parastagonospora nodorum]KAH3940026.1 hypothetical protein HBH53_224230 [Parastagonospora nodorum]KAH3957607.1 hypothetical protein HBH51_222470 [Parastagonospora nodorum]
MAHSLAIMIIFATFTFRIDSRCILEGTACRIGPKIEHSAPSPHHTVMFDLALRCATQRQRVHTNLVQVSFRLTTIAKVCLRRGRYQVAK